MATKVLATLPAPVDRSLEFSLFPCSVAGLKCAEILLAFPLRNHKCKIKLHPPPTIWLHVLVFLSRSSKMKHFVLLSLSSLATVRAQAVFNPKNGGTSYNGTNPSFSVDLSSLYNNRGFSMKANDSNFDGYDSGYPADSLPPLNFLYNGISFTFPTYKTSGNDNVLCFSPNDASTSRPII